MVFVLAVFAMGCLIAALRWAADGFDRVFFLVAGAANIIAAGLMIADKYEYAFRLMPNPW